MKQKFFKRRFNCRIKNISSRIFKSTVLDFNKRISATACSLNGNKGATIVTIMLAMFFLLTLGSIMIFMSYTALQIERTEAVGTRSFYDGEALVDEMKVGLQNAASDSAVEAHEILFKQYNSDNTKLGTIMVGRLDNWQTSGTPAVQLLEQFGTNSDGTPRYVYNTEAFAAFVVEAGASWDDIYIEGVSDPSDTARPIHIDGNVVGFVGTYKNGGTVEYDQHTVTFKGVSLTYIDPETEIKTSITTDFVIELPDQFFANSGDIVLDFSDVTDYSLVATETLTATTGSYGGGIYADKINITGETTEFSDSVVTREGLSLSVGSEVELTNTASVWANDITLLNEAEINSKSGGTVYLQNDLALNGDRSSADIEGSLIGFGNSTTDPEKSSSIIINGVDSSLDLSSTERLMLAGHSFIMAQKGTAGSFLMGESISARTNQLAYLAPTHILTAANSDIKTNPHVIETGTAPPDISSINKDTVILGGSSLNSYSATVEQLIYPLVGTNQSAVYYFINFKDTANANDYFREYFSNNKSDITEYIDAFADLSYVTNNAQTSGNFIEGTSGSYSMPSINPVTDETAEFIAWSYENLTKSLTTFPSNASDPFDHIVDKNEIDNFIKTNPITGDVWEFKNTAGDTVAVLSYNEQSGSLSTLAYPDAKLIVATGDVTVNGTFSGMILSNENINISGAANISSNSAAVREAFSAEYNGTPISVLFSTAGTTAVGGASALDDIEDITDMVRYENWTKN